MIKIEVIRKGICMLHMLIPDSENTFEGIYYNKKHVAVKRVNKKKIGKDGKDEESNREEFEAWSNIMNQSTHVLPCYHISEDNDYYYFGVARCLCNLEYFITDHIAIQQEYWEQQGTGKGIDEIFCLFSETNEPTTEWNDMIRDIIEGLSFIYRRGYTHTFLNCSHILISDEFRPVIGNYGKCIRIDKLAGWTAGSRNKGWRALELIRNEKKNQTNAVDIFSLGCIFYYCLHRRHLYSSGPNESLPTLEANIKDQKPSSDQLNYLKNRCEEYDLVLCLISADPSLRLPAIEIYKHPFFWSMAKRCNFIRETYEWLQLGGQVQWRLHSELERKAVDVFSLYWHRGLHNNFYEAVVLDNSYNPRSLYIFMSFFRNGIVRIADVSLKLGQAQPSFARPRIGRHTELLLLLLQ